MFECNVEFGDEKEPEEKRVGKLYWLIKGGLGWGMRKIRKQDDERKQVDNVLVTCNDIPAALPIIFC